jgi:transglutaminase-like putative cysteine protease
MRYLATHTTRYRYEAPVSQCHSEVRLTPRSLPWQTVFESTIRTVPDPAWNDARKDYFGNEVHAFSILESHDEFTTVATSLVQVDAREAPAPGVTWEEARDAIAGHASPPLLEAFEFVFDSPLVGVAPALAGYAAPSFEQKRPLAEAVQDLSHRIHTEFAYAPNTTSIETPLLDTLRRKRGVCQDFSHVMIGALRSMGLAARYVSGYLRSGANYQGAEASHAWVSVFVPGSGWMDIDPTNDVIPSTGHVTVAWGRDYRDVTPIKGVALGGGKQIVDVEVRVTPAE